MTFLLIKTGLRGKTCREEERVGTLSTRILRDKEKV